jgi:radical SAM superfamily enzyme YgiQ (UPF0313 family)
MEYEKQLKSIQGFISLAKKLDPDIIGFSTNTFNATTSNALSEAVKRQLPNTKIVYGGFHATLNPVKILKAYPFVDIIVRGEGEFTMLDIVNSVEKNSSLEGVKGVTYRDNGKIKNNPERPVIEKLDDLPYPDRNLLSHRYCSEMYGFRFKTGKFTLVIGSRGCPYECRFCCQWVMWKRRCRIRSPQNIVDEISYLASQGYTRFAFADDTLTVNKKNVIELCRLMRKEKLDFIWYAETRVDNVSDEMLKAMKDAGCDAIQYGIESAVPRILEYYRKHITPSMVEQAIKKTAKVGLDSVGAFILGAPTETKEEMWQTILFAEKIPLTVPHLNILFASPGMPIWDDLVEKGYIDPEKNWEKPVLVSAICRDCVPPDEIREIINLGYRHFVMRPKYLIRQIFKNMVKTDRLVNIFLNIPTLLADRLEKTLGVKPSLPYHSYAEKAGD